MAIYQCIGKLKQRWTSSRNLHVPFLSVKRNMDLGHTCILCHWAQWLLAQLGLSFNKIYFFSQISVSCQWTNLICWSTIFDKCRVLLAAFSFSLLRINEFILLSHMCGRRGGLIVRVLDSGSSGPGSGPGRGHCVVFLGKTLYSHGASLRLGV